MIRICLAPEFKENLERIKNSLRPFETGELIQFLQEIIDYPHKGEKKHGTNIYKRGIITYFFTFTVTYEYTENREIIFWDIR